MLNFIAWYLTITILGLLTFPLAYRLLPALADRGYALSRSLGLLLWGFIFWLSVSLGMAQNNLGGLLLALAILVGLSAWANWVRSETQTATLNFRPVFDWLKSNLRYVSSVEILFLVAFALWAFVRANNPELVGTEKPMEIAFINAIIHSPTFPPHDPWLSGYAISYYYFGYVLTAMLAEITATVGSVAFNLMLALIFGLSIIGAFGLLYNLLVSYWAAKDGQPKPSAANRLKSTIGAFLAPLFLIILGNWEALLEVLRKRGIGWTVNADGTFSDPAPFWSWLNMLDLKDAPLPVQGGIFERLSFWWGEDGFNGLGRWFAEAFMPERNWWWWRASRVVHDYDLSGNHLEVIDEFPFFSYLLGDLHPHVLAMPFGLLAGALALNLYLGGWKGEIKLFTLPKWEVQWPAWLNRLAGFEVKLPIRPAAFLVLAVVLGGLAFLNTWDFPIYLALICGALILMLMQERSWNWDKLEDFLQFTIPLVVFGLLLAVLSVVLYLPFYIGFSSQAGGIAPNVIFPTRAAHLWIMFGGLFVPIFAWLFYLRGRQNANWKMGFLLAGGLALFLWVFSTAVALSLASTPIGQQFINSQGLSSTWDALREASMRRLAYGGGLLTLVILVGAAAAYLTAIKAGGGEAGAAQPTVRGPLPFVLMFILFGGLLVLAPEFIYLRDHFGNRMNTIFKFYYEAWALWAIAAAFAIAVMLSELRGLARGGYTVVIVVLVGIGLIYPALSIPNKTNGFDASFPKEDPNTGEQIPPTLTLDGAVNLIRYAPNDYRAILFLKEAAPGTVAEAVGGQYSDFGRVSIYSGQPTVLGWPGHESQWRGGDSEMGTRQTDIQMLYNTRDWEQAQAIIKQYGIRYIYIGPMERQTYAVYEDKFTKNLAQIYNQDDVVIYVVP